MYDGRYVFACYFSSKQHNRPTTLEDLYRLSDVELFDLQADPLEVDNLAMGGKQHRELGAGMNEKLNGFIDAEVRVRQDCSPPAAGRSGPGEGRDAHHTSRPLM